ncbi:interleukin-15 receptor subunit alpha isoform X4 [Homo sapiens]|uniref:interleukin-15 receptor subunit alpha isoform X4 n=1 Tax=Homo sapiens TaxID=9606 RepID=UPI0005D007AA|nr:interleukin-15 receptor subunit alpha isoform X4 [Homo sapiens]|eukprot:XP_011517766.1 interleukin-15 receptor subunit alpha isoform X4 [Homo sapiens]
MTEAWRCLVLSNVTARPENLHLGAYRPGSQASLETPRKKKTHQPKRRMAAWKNLRKRGSEWGHRTECTLEVPEHDERGGPGGSRACVGITCPPPMSVEHADIWVKSYSLYSRERYICNSGFKRKAGTSSLTECVLNKATNVAHWTTPSLKCIRDPALVHQRPAPPSTVTTAGVTPQPESLSPSGKEPAASSPSSNNTAATTAAIVPGSQLMPSKSPSTGTTEISSHESSHGTPSQTTAKNWELTASASHQPPGVYPQGHSDTTVAISTSTVLLCGLSAVSLLACYLKSSSQRKVTYLRLSVNYKAPPGVGDVYREDTSVWAPPNDPVSSCAARTDREPEKVEEMLSPVNPLHRRIQEEENSSQRHFTYICIYTSLSVISTHYI